MYPMRFIITCQDCKQRVDSGLVIDDASWETGTVVIRNNVVLCPNDHRTTWSPGEAHVEQVRGD